MWCTVLYTGEVLRCGVGCDVQVSSCAVGCYIQVRFLWCRVLYTGEAPVVWSTVLYTGEAYMASPMPLKVSLAGECMFVAGT